jgi:hypothetical protein
VCFIGYELNFDFFKITLILKELLVLKIII